jgi:hypothetical protein
MDMDAVKKRLHCRIEEADEEMLAVLAGMTEKVFEAYLQTAQEQSEAYKIEAKTDLLRPRSRKEMTKEIEVAMENYVKGETITLTTTNKEADVW